MKMYKNAVSNVEIFGCPHCKGCCVTIFFSIVLLTKIESSIIIHMTEQKLLAFLSRKF